MVLILRLVTFVAQSAVHLLFYVVPRVVFAALIKGPLTLIEQAIGDQRTFAETDRMIHVATHWRNKATLEAFGLEEVGMLYPSPLYNGHLQTLLGVLRCVPPTKYARLPMKGFDGCTICHDWSLAATSSPGGPRSQPSGVRGVFVVLPGLASGSSASYIRNFVRHANRAGFHCCVMNTRGMGDTPLETPQLMSAVFTEDLRTTLHQRAFLRAAADAGLIAHTSFPIFLIGFSLGGTVMLNYLCEEGKARRTGSTRPASDVTAAFSVCSPWDMHESTNFILKPTGRLLYQVALTNGLRRYALRHRDVLDKIPELDTALLFEENEISRISTVQEYDHHVVVPHFGFACVEDYYTAGTTITKLNLVDVPLLCIGAADDPVTGPPPELRRWEAVAQLNPNIVFLLMPSGGHLGFLGTPCEELQQQCEISHRTVLHAAKSILQAKA